MKQVAETFVQTIIACLIVWTALGVLASTGCMLEQANAQRIIRGK